MLLSCRNVKKGKMAENLSSTKTVLVRTIHPSDLVAMKCLLMVTDLNASRQDAIMIFSHHVVKRIQAKKRMSEQQVMELPTPEALEEVEQFFARIVDLPFCFDRHNKKFSNSAHVSRHLIIMRSS